MLEEERAKYEKAWADPRYSEYSPGEHLVERAVRELGMTTFDSVIDFGCGTGRAANRLLANQFDVIGVDFVDALQVEVPFVNACLWDMPPLYAHWGFCTDVMEHIPPQKVDKVLDQIRNRTGKGCFFQIATEKDHFGSLIGETLHMTVEKGDWWAKRLGDHWDHVKIRESSTQLTAICKPKS